MDNNPLSLFNYTRKISETIFLNAELHNVWVRAEITDLSYKGHCYMYLIEKDRQGQTIARMKATIWRSTFEAIRREYAAQGLELPVANGLKVLVYGEANHHPNYGFSFNVTKIKPDSEGDLERIRKEILEALRKEGVLDRNKSVPLPPDIQRIAVISSPEAAGYGDFMDQLVNNSDGFQFYPHLFPAVMQGEKTPPSVMQALEAIEMTIDLWDCVVIIRGGGATSDMNAFDDLTLARRVATFPLPVVIGIGHERDRNVLDEIACVRCKTPTAVAAFLIDSLRNTWSATWQSMNSIVREVQGRVESERRRLSQMEIYVPVAVRKILDDNRNLLANMAQTIPAAVDRRTSTENEKLKAVAGMIASGASNRLLRASDSLQNLTASLKDNVARRLAENAERLKSLESLVQVLSPANTLKRGYSITRINGHAISDSRSLHPGDEVETETASGRFKSKITEL